MSKASRPSEYSIAAVSKLSGVSCHALRVWERRYGFPVPRRSPSGHRRYGAEQVRLLRRIAELSRQGRPIGELIAAAMAGELGGDDAPAAGPGHAPAVATLVDRLAAGEVEAAAADFDEQARRLGPAELVVRVVEPALIDAGERWFRGDFEVFHERGVTGFLFQKLEGLLDAARRANPRPRRRALLGVVQGDRHEGGMLMVAVLLELAGWRALPIGTDLPVREYQRAIDAWQPDALGLSFVMSRNINKRFRELERLRGAPVFVGGRSILNYQGLARRHGLIPLVGPASSAVGQLVAQFEALGEGERRSGPAGARAAARRNDDAPRGRGASSGVEG
ncbi:MAG TPA: MerR family transcriptional regulator [Isosphaeraceae bacterium]|nr:MerR family transcriptional regulator [Isosphaeraceae bacterium]